MILLKKNNGTTNIIVTLNESKSTGAQSYVFTFTNVVTNGVIAVTFSSDDDISNAPYRYNEFALNTALFDTVDAGQYNYTVKEVSTNNILENGKMVLQPEVEIIKHGYNPATTIKGYAG